MAISRAIIIFVKALIAATIFSKVAMATDYIVGDDKGWIPNFDYEAWARNKVFRVDDTIEFNYPAGKDSVVIVNSTNFISCNVPPNAPEFSDGHDIFRFIAPGTIHFISGVVDHCNEGQKLSFIVFPASPPAPSPSSVPEPAPAPAPSSYHASASWTHFSNLARSNPRKLSKVFH